MLKKFRKLSNVVIFLFSLFYSLVSFGDYCTDIDNAPYYFYNCNNISPQSLIISKTNCPDEPKLVKMTTGTSYRFPYCLSNVYLMHDDKGIAYFAFANVTSHADSSGYNVVLIRKSHGDECTILYKSGTVWNVDAGDWGCGSGQQGYYPDTD